MGFFLGIDGGGTKTECMVGDETKALGWAGAGSSKIARVGEEAANAALRDGIERACTAAGITASLIQRTCVGVAGVSQSDSVAAIRRWLSGWVGGEVDVIADSEIAHYAAFAGGAGIIVIAGTGSIAYGRNAQGEAARAGGLAPASGDPGSGEWIGRTAINLALQANEYGQNSTLLNAILKAWKLDHAQALARMASALPAPDFAALFPIIAVSSDALARRVLVRAARELSLLVADVVKRLWPDAKPLDVAMYGGVLENSSEVRDAFTADLGERHPQARVAAGKRRPAEGALLMARNALVKSSAEAASH